jgi:periplasmic protein TonB
MSAVMHTDPNRAFNYAVLASIVLHALLLFGFSQRNAAKRPAPPTPIFARLVQPPPVVEPAPVVPQSEPVKPKAVVKPEAPRAAAKSKPAPKAAPQPPVVEAVPPPADPAPSAPTAAPAAPVSPPVVARTDPAPAPAAPSAETMDAGSLAQYRLQLISTARKYKRYPRVAIDNNWEGDVVVWMVVGANGGISALNVKTSSGHEVLDQQALEMFKKAKPLVEIPPALRGKEFALELRAIYNLKDRDSG